MNKVLLLGNLTREPELKKSASGKYVLDFTIAKKERSIYHKKQEIKKLEYN